MPYRRKRYTKKRTYGKRRRATLPVKVTRLSRQVARLKPETKFYFANGAASALSNDFNAMIAPCRDIAQGSPDAGYRIGDTIRIASYQLDIRTFLAAGAPTKLLRVIVFTYKHNPDSITTAFATIGNLLMETSYANNSAYAPMAPFDHDNRASFCVHYDKIFHIKPDNGAATATYGSYRHIRIRPKISNRFREVQYVGAGQTISRNELMVLLITNDDSTMVYDYIGHFRYTDV